MEVQTEINIFNHDLLLSLSLGKLTLKEALLQIAKNYMSQVNDADILLIEVKKNSAIKLIFGNSKRDVDHWLKTLIESKQFNLSQKFSFEANEQEYTFIPIASLVGNTKFALIIQTTSLKLINELETGLKLLARQELVFKDTNDKEKLHNYTEELTVQNEELRIRQKEALTWKELFENFVYNSPTPVFEIDKSGKLINQNKKGRDLMGERAFIYPFSKLIVPEERKDFIFFTHEIFQKKISQTKILRIYLGQKIKHVKFEGIYHQDIKDRESCIISISDISELIRKNEEINAIKEEFEHTLDSVPTLIWKSGLDRKCFYFNKPWLDFTGKSLTEEQGNGWAEGVHPDDFERCLNIYNQSFDRQIQFEMNYRLKRYDGQYRWINDRGEPRYDKKGNFLGYIGGCIDIHDQVISSKQKEEAQEQLKLMAIIAKNTLNAVIITTPNGLIQWVNEGFTKLTQYSLEEVLDKKPGDFLQGELTEKETIKKISKAIKNKQPIVCEIVNYKKDNTPYWNRLEIQPIFSAEGEIVNFIGLQTDISERKEYESMLEKKNDMLKQANNELDSFVYRVSHDLRAPITSSLGLLQLCSMTTDIKKIDSYLKIQNQSLKKLDKFILDVLLYSRNNRMIVNKSYLDLQEILTDISAQHKSEIENIELLIDFPDSTTIYSDPLRIKIILNNLISNSLKFTRPYEENKFIKVSLKILTETYLISVEDNGTGIKEEYLDDIFHMFQRATNDKYGSGLGLYILKEAVQKISGTVKVESEYGAWTRFLISIPKEQKTSK